MKNILLKLNHSIQLFFVQFKNTTKKIMISSALIKTHPSVLVCFFIGTISILITNCILNQSIIYNFNFINLEPYIFFFKFSSLIYLFILTIIILRSLSNTILLFQIETEPRSKLIIFFYIIVKSLPLGYISHSIFKLINTDFHSNLIYSLFIIFFILLYILKFLFLLLENSKYKNSNLLYKIILDRTIKISIIGYIVYVFLNLIKIFIYIFAGVVPFNFLNYYIYSDSNAESADMITQLNFNNSPSLNNINSSAIPLLPPVQEGLEGLDEYNNDRLKYQNLLLAVQAKEHNLQNLYSSFNLFLLPKEDKIMLLQDQLGTVYKDINVLETYLNMIEDQLLNPRNFKNSNLIFNSSLYYPWYSLYFQFSINHSYMDGSLVERLTYYFNDYKNPTEQSETDSSAILYLAGVLKSQAEYPILQKLEIVQQITIEAEKILEIGQNLGYISESDSDSSDKEN